MYNQQYDDFPSFTFIGSQEKFDEPLERSHLSNAYLLLKFIPKCLCDKEFRASGKAKAEERIAQHKGYKKYEKCNPTVEEIVYSVPEFITLRQLFGSDANENRNKELSRQMETADQYSFPTVMDGYQIKQGANLRNIKVIRKSPVRSVKQNTLKVCDITLEDENGDNITMTLWNGQTDSIKLNDELVIRNAKAEDGQQYYGHGYGYGDIVKLGTYKNASSIEVVQK